MRKSWRVNHNTHIEKKDFVVFSNASQGYNGFNIKGNVLRELHIKKDLKKRIKGDNYEAESQI
jgi:hypothetical protein